jgi:hypothetical protein
MAVLAMAREANRGVRMSGRRSIAVDMAIDTAVYSAMQSRPFVEKGIRKKIVAADSQEPKIFRPQ